MACDWVMLVNLITPARHGRIGISLRQCPASKLVIECMLKSCRLVCTCMQNPRKWTPKPEANYLPWQNSQKLYKAKPSYW